MKAVSFPRPERVEIIDIDEPTPGPEDLLIEVQYAGLCGSDLNIYRGAYPHTEYPIIPGHEIGGVVMGKGDAVPASFAIGAQVMLSPFVECGVCSSCRQGRFNCCENNRTLGVQRNGAMTHRVVFPYRKVHASAILTTQELALVEPLSIGSHAVNRARVTAEDTVLVLGCGTIGMGVILAALRRGATVIGLDVAESKLAMAQRFGVQHLINPSREDPLKAIHALTNGEGAAVAIEAVGAPATYRLAIDMVAYAGRVAVVGYAKEEITFDTAMWVRKELDILGARNVLGEFSDVIAMLEARDKPYHELISAVYPLEEAGRAFADWSAAPGDFVKIQLDLTEK
ncbi:MAG: zinc-binding alcohol dehydrogenase family protein [Caldilineaceae bacterium]|nr:zinc-binding alcohol dehydrogenase family protein [Caldilineaceae bacterium]